MSETTKIVAAILTAGRVPTFETVVPRPMDDWLAEYNAWVEVLEAQDKAAEKAAADASTKNMMDRFDGQLK